MRSFHRLPPFLRGASVAGLLFLLVSLVLTFIGWWSHTHSSVDTTRITIVALNLIIAGVMCSMVVALYSKRFAGQQVMRRQNFLDSWQHQLRAVLLLGALPVCAVILAFVIAPSSASFGFAFLVTMLGALVLLATTLFSLATG